MAFFRSCVRTAALALAVYVPFGAVSADVHAQRFTRQQTAVALVLVGQVQEPILGSASSPDEFTLQLGTQTWDVHLTKKAIITARGPEAFVEGIVPGDFAVVRGKRIDRVLASRVVSTFFASRVVYDVAPMAPLRMFSGQVVRITPDGMHFILKIDKTHRVLLRMVHETRVHMDSRPFDATATLAATQMVDVVARRENGAWTAYDVSIKSALMMRRAGISHTA